MITDLTGRADSRGFWFKLEKYTEVSYSCAVNFKGRSYVYGGYKEPYQLSMVDGCALTRVGDLPFPYTEGACTNTPNHVFLCFENLSDYKTCRVSHSATGPFEPVSTSLYDHKYIRVAVSESKYARIDISQCAFLSRFTCRRISLDVATQPGRVIFFCKQRVACYCGISLRRITFRSSSCLRWLRFLYVRRTGWQFNEHNCPVGWSQLQLGPNWHDEHIAKGTQRYIPRQFLFGRWRRWQCDEREVSTFKGQNVLFRTDPNARQLLRLSWAVPYWKRLLSTVAMSIKT